MTTGVFSRRSETSAFPTPLRAEVAGIDGVLLNSKSFFPFKGIVGNFLQGEVPTLLHTHNRDVRKLQI